MTTRIIPSIYKNTRRLNLFYFPVQNPSCRFLVDLCSSKNTPYPFCYQAYRGYLLTLGAYVIILRDEQLTSCIFLPSFKERCIHMARFTFEGIARYMWMNNLFGITVSRPKYSLAACLFCCCSLQSDTFEAAQIVTDYWIVLCDYEWTRNNFESSSVLFDFIIKVSLWLSFTCNVRCCCKIILVINGIYSTFFAYMY